MKNSGLCEQLGFVSSKDLPKCNIVPSSDLCPHPSSNHMPHHKDFISTVTKFQTLTNIMLENRYIKQMFDCLPCVGNFAKQIICDVFWR